MRPHVVHSNSPPPPYHSSYSETDPLIPCTPSHRRQSINVWISTALVALLTAAISITIYASVFNNSDVQNRIRKEWDIELRQHQEEFLKRIEIEKRWHLEDNERIRLREQWGSEVEEHHREDEKRILLREQWGREVDEHNREVEEGRRREELENIRNRNQWQREVEEHDREVKENRRREEEERIRIREQWGREVAEHDRKVEERQKREEEERLRLNMFWTDPEPHMCTTYSTREFTARLVNVPSYYNRRVEACMATAIQIHGVESTPKWCEDHGPNNVVGHWEVDQQQPDCVSHWTWYKDLGCVSPGSGQRRIEQYLKNIPSGGDWREFCATTPTSFNGVHFIGAQSCLLDRNNDGTWGYWDIDDESCN